jgi:hypothetical protein
MVCSHDSMNGEGLEAYQAWRQRTASLRTTRFLSSTAADSAFNTWFSETMEKVSCYQPHKILSWFTAVLIYFHFRPAGNQMLPLNDKKNIVIIA